MFLGKNVQALEDDYVHKHMHGKKTVHVMVFVIGTCTGAGCTIFATLNDLIGKKQEKLDFSCSSSSSSSAPGRQQPSPNNPCPFFFFVTTARSDCSPGGDAHALLCICSEIQIQGLSRKYQLCCFDWLFESWNVLGLVF